MDIALSAEEKRALCSIARNAIDARLMGKKPPEVPRLPGLGLKLGAFVTLHENDQLRGCIGRMKSELPLGETVAVMALAAAFEDPRFEPLLRPELDAIDIEITVLGPLIKIREASELIAGSHGLYIIHRGRSGVLLPQVAVEYGWDGPEFLDHVCLKAGLAPGSWKDPAAQLFVFEGLVFGEKD